MGQSKPGASLGPFRLSDLERRGVGPPAPDADVGIVSTNPIAARRGAEAVQLFQGPPGRLRGPGRLGPDIVAVPPTIQARIPL